MIFHLILSNLNNVFVRYQIFFFFPGKICSSCHIFNACVQIQIYIYIYICTLNVFQNIKLLSIFSCEEVLLEVFIDSGIKKLRLLRSIN